MSSLSDQLLKAGLVSADQVKKAKEKPKNPPRKKFKKTNKKQSVKNEESDLAQFYKQRVTQDRKEKQEEIKMKQQAAKIKKETTVKINKLISNNSLNDESAEIRYNFVVGTTIKYIFVTGEQQDSLAKGQIAITFLGGKRHLIPVDTANEILKLNPNKIVVLLGNGSN